MGGRRRPLTRWFVWDPTGDSIELPALANFAGHLDVVGWNDAGVAIANYGGEDRPQVFHDGILEDLNQLIAADSGWQLLQVSGINNAGQIVGKGLYNGQPAAFLLTPVPEPMVFLPAILGMLASHRSRR